MKKGDHPDNDPKIENQTGLNRREFVKTGGAAGLGSGALLVSDEARAQVRETGASVLVIYQNFDLGGSRLDGGYASIGQSRIRQGPGRRGHGLLQEVRSEVEDMVTRRCSWRGQPSFAFPALFVDGI